MDNEKMKILKMLEEGRITSGDAARLLELANNPIHNQPNNNNNNNNNNNHNHYNNGTSSEPKPSFDDFANNLGKKFDIFMQDLEPTLKNIGGVVVEKTSIAAEKLNQAFSTPPRTDSYRPAEHPRNMNPSGAGTRNLEKKYNIPVTSDQNILNITAINSNIIIKGYNGDKITATIHYIPVSGNPNIELMTLGNKFFLDYSEEHFSNVGIEAYIPERLFKNIDLSAYNSNIKVSTISSEFINIYSTNGNIEIENTYAKNIKLQSENGKNLSFNNVSADNALLESFGGNIKALNLDMANLELMTSNGSIEVMNADFKLFNNYKWLIETSNKDVKINLPNSTEIGYHLKAEAPLSTIRVGLTGLNYTHNDSNKVEATSTNFDSAYKKIKLKLETSNAKLFVN